MSCRSENDYREEDKKREPPRFHPGEDRGFLALERDCEELFGETWYGGVLCIVSKISTLIAFGSVCRRARSRPNRKF